MAQRSPRGDGLEWSQVRVGVLLIVALGILAYAVYRVGDLFDVFADRYTLVTLLGRADGLLEGAPVTLAGQRVGQVEQIEFLPVNGGPSNLSVQLSINRESQPYIRADSYARVRTQGLLGDRYVDIAPGSPRARILEPMDTLPGIDPVDVEELLVTADETLVEVRAVVRDLRTITTGLVQGKGTLGQLLVDDALYRRLEGAATEIEGLVAAIRDGNGTLARMIYDPTLYEELVDAATRVDSLANAILYGQGTVARLLQSDEAYEALLGVLGRADTTITALGGTFGALADGDGTLQRLLHDPAMYDEFLRAVIDLQTLINDIRENPTRYRPAVNIDIF